MNDQNLYIISIKKKKYSSYLGEISPSVPNLLNRNFKADKPNEKLLTGITEFSITDTKKNRSCIILGQIFETDSGIPKRLKTDNMKTTTDHIRAAMKLLRTVDKIL